MDGATSDLESFEFRTLVLHGVPPDTDPDELRKKIERQLVAKKAEISVKCVLGPIKSEQIALQGPSKSCFLVTLSSQKGKRTLYTQKYELFYFCDSSCFNKRF